jgi:hypothetical protein
MLVLTSFYMAIFGFFGMLASCGAPVVKNRFGFLRNRCGRGFFLFFIGTLAVGQGLNFTYTENLTLAAGITSVILGFAQMISYSCVSSGGVYRASSQSDGPSNAPMLRDTSGKLLIHDVSDR